MKSKTRLMIEYADRLVGDYTTMSFEDVMVAMFDYGAFIDAKCVEYIEACDELRARRERPPTPDLQPRTENRTPTGVPKRPKPITVN